MVKRLNQAHIKSWFPKRSKWAHKGSVGRILLISGSKGMAGAAVLSSLGAMRSGAGLVKLFTETPVESLLARRTPVEVMVQGGSSPKEMRRVLASFKPSVIAMGPGLGRTTRAKTLLKAVIGNKSIPLVLDADALVSLPKIKKPAIITPHEGELSRLLKVPAKTIHHNRECYVTMAAKKFNVVCVLKGSGSLISDGKTVFKNTTGNPGMASGGMGDVLTGVVASIWGQYPDQSKNTALKAACCAVYIHGLAADLMVRKVGQLSLVASDVAEGLIKAIRKIR